MSVARERLEAQVKNGPYSNHVTPISGAFTFTARDNGAVPDSVDGVPEWMTRDGVRWRLALDHVQTKAVAHYPRCGGRIRGLYRYHRHKAGDAPLLAPTHTAVGRATFV